MIAPHARPWNTSFGVHDLALNPLLDALPWPSALLDENGVVVHVSAAMCRRGVESAQVVGRSLPEAFPEYHAALRGPLPWLVEQDAEVVRQVGPAVVHERIWLRRVGTGACLILQDETHLKQMETQAAQSAQTTRLASLGFMLAGVCHEVSNPLAAIHSMVQILQSDRGASRTTLQKGLANIAHNVQRVLDISKRLNDFSRTGQKEQAPLRVDWAIQEALVFLRQGGTLDAVAVEHRADPQAMVLGNLVQLQQVFFNILLNAVQAMNSSGRIGITTRRASFGLVEVAIGDTGPGIEPQHLPRLFEPFYTTKPSGQGTGLGLAISNEIVNEHGGSITAENGADGGAVFCVRLPLHERQA